MTVVETVTTVESVRARLQEAGVKYAMASFVDLHGSIKTKFVPLSHLERMAGGSVHYSVKLSV